VSLTSQQAKVVDAKGNFLLLACPGSGKTRAAAARVARLVDQTPTKVAVCSYTNVGAERLGAVLSADHGAVLGHEHFLGTLHTFLLRFVVYPFAHLIGAPAGPFLREGDNWYEVLVDSDPKSRIALDKFRRTPDGGLAISNIPYYIRKTPEQVIASVGADVIARKDGLFTKAGVISTDDAMWVALQILQKRPDVAEAVARRFDELLLDEAQDTSELQLACLDRLCRTGKLRSVVLIGDLEQSIFSFQGASAAGCRQLATNRSLDLMELTENHRCSQLICDVAVHFCSRETPDTAIGPAAACPIAPEVALYPHKDLPSVIGIFRSRLAHHGIDTDHAAVLARRWSVINAITGETTKATVEPRPRVVGRLARALASGTLTRSDVRSAQRVVAYAAWGIDNLDALDDEQLESLRPATYGFLRDLPDLSGDLQQWVKSAAASLESAAKTLVTKPKHSGPQSLRAKTAYAARQAADVFAAPPTDLRPQTVHDIKGEDREAVMVVIRRAHAADPTKHLELWEATTAGSQIAAEQEEERRITFVALTRAQRLCLIALPDDSRGQAVANGCTKLGFVDVTSGL
jgi:DNA helicase-2/ATP-dependent DNA helicase PcrA